MRFRTLLAAGALTVGLLGGARSANAETIQLVYLCGPTVEILLKDTQRWLFADTSDPSVPTTDKMVDRIYAAALATWLSGRSVTFFDPSATPVSCIPCICGGITAFRINVLQVQ